MTKTAGASVRAFWRFSICLLMLIFFFPLFSRGQEVTAALNGTVTDPSGAAVSGARVVAKDLDRGTEFATTTNGNGAYGLPRLPVGRYEIRVENPGFQSAHRSDILLVL